MSEPEPVLREPTTTRSGVGGVAATLARFDRPRGPGTTFAVLADAHLRPPEHSCGSTDRDTGADGDDADARFGDADNCLGDGATGGSDGDRSDGDRSDGDVGGGDDEREGGRDSARRDPSKRRFERAIADADRLDVDAILVAGDLTRSGASVEHELAANLLADAPAPVVTVPGDRDVRSTEEHTDSPYPEEWTAAAGPTACPYARRIEGVTVLGVDTATGDDDVPTATHGGAVTRAERSWIARTARADPDPAICLTHHPIAPLPDQFDAALDDRRHRVRSPARTADVLAEAGVELAIGGHLRWPTATRYRDLNAVGAPSTTAFPPSYLLVDVEPRGTTVSLVPLTDWAGLETAYQVACARNGRGDAIRAAVADGYFNGLPAVDRQRDPSPRQVAPPAPLRRP